MIKNSSSSSHKMQMGRKSSSTTIITFQFLFNQPVLLRLLQVRLSPHKSTKEPEWIAGMRFYRSYVLSVTQPIASKHWKGLLINKQ